MNSSIVSSGHIELKSVLVATDLTESADRALAHGIAIAHHFHARLYLVHVVSSLGFTLAGPDAIEIGAEVSEREIDCVVNHLAGSGGLDGVEVRPVVLKGNVEAEIAYLARDEQIDLIVVGTHGRQGIARMFFGSIAQLISRCCCCPVLTVGPHAPGPWLGNASGSRGPLLVATAFNPASAKAMPLAVSMANDLGRDLFVLHVVPPHRAEVIKKDSRAHQAAEASARAQLNALLPPGAGLKHQAHVLVECCDPADGILRAANRLQAANILMGVHRDSLSDLAARAPWSIANRVNREARCPVLTVRG